MGANPWLFLKMHWVCHNGNFLPHDQPLFCAANRGFRYGDGLFETAKFYDGKLLLSAFHFERLFSGLQLLQIATQFNAEVLASHISSLCRQNRCAALARVRIAVYRNDDNSASYLIEATGLEPDKMRWNEQGWRLMLHPAVQKSCDVFSNLKTANYLPYVMAARHAAEWGADECLVRNAHNRICDGSKTNLFFMTGGSVSTPALAEGPVAGVMRRAVMGFLKSSGYAVHEQLVMEQDVLDADAVFVTNAIEGLRWVQQFGEKKYGHGVLKKLYHELAATIYGSGIE